MNHSVMRLFTLAFTLGIGVLSAEEEMPPGAYNNGWQSLIMIAIAFVFFYFILWRPEQRRRKEIEGKRAALQKGDRVNAMGILGTVVRVQEHSVILKMVDGSKIEVVKAAISEVLPGGGDAEVKQEDE